MNSTLFKTNLAAIAAAGLAAPISSAHAQAVNFDGVIIANVIAHHGCPCPGIGDVALGLSDTILHFGYNVLAYAGVAVAYAYVVRDRRRL